MSVAISNPASPATRARTSFSVKASAAVTEAKRWSRGASSTAWRCTSVSRSASAAGRDSWISAFMTGPASADSLRQLFEQAFLLIFRGILQILPHLVLVRQLVDAGIGVFARLVGLDDMGAHEQEQFGPILLVGAAAQQLAEDGNLVEKSQFGADGGMLGLLQPTEHDHLAIAHVDKRGGFAVADDGLDVG